jgi:UDP-N-acetylmuramoyl-L-alanyl-D-glutamate--2,6-diaminopimelate ligase
MRTTRDLAAKFSLELIGDANLGVSGVAINTSHVQAGSLFIAAPGAKTHGLDHLDAAIAAGAVAVLSDSKEPLRVPNLYHPNPRVIAGDVASYVYQTDESNMLLYAVTGTNGKTSTVFYLRELLSALGQSAGLISSAFLKVGNTTIAADLTTPEAPRTHQLLAQMREQHQSSAAIEASAQGLSRARVQGLHFRIAGFTNLSRDHLDDYPDMDSYLEAKAKLFTPEYADKAVVLIEDEYSQKLFDGIQIPKVSIGGDYQVRYHDGLIQIEGKQSLSARVSLSALMAKNLGLALVMLLEDRYSPEKLERALEMISLEVPGRLQKISESKPFLFVDYAHTPDAVASSARELSRDFEFLTIVLAASGDRDRGKRPEMAKAAAKYATKVVVTDQHPRSEDPALIRKDLVAGFGDFSDYVEIADPKSAIEAAISLTPERGAILWCGPGHLKYREIAGQKVEFDAIEIARKALEHD